MNPQFSDNGTMNTRTLNFGWSGAWLAASALLAGPLAPSTAHDTNTTARSRQIVAEVRYNRDVRPILSDHCFACHGPDANQRQADLRLDRREEAWAAGVFDAEQPEASEFLQRVTSSDPDEVMPPPHFLKPLSPSQIEILKRWVAAGAPYEDHWSYVAPVKAEVPPRVHPIDYWVDRSIAAQGLPAGPQAEKETLLRRLFLDLVGIPPTPAEQTEFILDQRPDAFERCVDRLLNSPQFGERMAAAWLDVVRYADTVGYHGDQNQNVFPYRDWVISAFNRNLPFDQFTLWQIAGDQLEQPTTETLIASAFNRLNMMTREGGAQPDEYLAKYAADRVRTVAGAWLGSTLGCAECHDHKYDPFTMEDFYSMAAFFADLRQWGVYQDYEYTPNPDLRGWSNDHPFPPELVVEVPYLQERIRRLEQRRAETIADSLRRHPPDEARWQSWQGEIKAFLQSYPDGWAFADGLKLEGESPTGRCVDQAWRWEGDKIDALTIVLPPTTFPILAVSIEILPDDSAGGRLFSAHEMQLHCAFAVESAADGKGRPVAVEFAAADHALPRYANTFEILGIQGGWKIAATVPRVRGVWQFAEPLRLADGQVLKLKVTGNRARHWRISLSPLVPQRLDRPDAWQQQLGQWQNGVASPAEATEFVGRQWALSGDSGGELAATIKSIERAIRECRDGRWPVQISQTQAPRETRILPRGNWQDPTGKVVQPATPHFLPKGHVQASSVSRRLNRLDLAKWLVAPENPLTARVQMNRLWKQFFGVGLSAVLDDVGIQGQYPSHPELLDWLAVEFRESGWNFKHMVRLIVTSSAYQRSSIPTPEQLRLDPTNRWLSRQNARRLEAEAVRDNALAIAGLLNLDMGGPPVFPYQPDHYYEHLQFPDRRYVASTDDRQYRRGVYVHWQRTFLHPMLANFDAPSREECTALRTEANTPQQSLTLLNDPTYVEAARVLAAHLIQEQADDTARVESLYRRAVARPPNAGERDSLMKFLTKQRAHFATNLPDAGRLVRIGLAPTPVDIPPEELAAWTQTVRAVLNLHETITRY